mmetsp:Transcript_18865/g.41194  ORF Transcript_18865/g.41194 Transcript_18865/m.41194 type:complete len:590 (+) Transcript_18865:65-1834(+)|eukprot:CAMPEP_0170616144 /NCGR_PEP_ID=MMETSP0224-20130122/25717_1 /TAXON_ID=285029 /ORGANISM="Togula jolla, Strain CCCM 725" /LENGTH=589 /DNA_ID=CAMNT_0010941929 /DNA_START=1 /DNA_END=1770 /DNA_ORIENTATION=+
MADEVREGSSDKKAHTGKPLSWLMLLACLTGTLGSLYTFFVGLALLGDAFKCMRGRDAGMMFTAIENPVSGLMTGVLATVLVQSSATSTSIVVGLVGASQLRVDAAIPVIMGANIGTSVTSIIVSLGQMAVPLDLHRAFAGATVHNIFNIFSVAVLLPIELVTAALQGEGGPIYWLSKAMAAGVMGALDPHELFTPPVERITAPVSEVLVSSNQYVINALSLGEPTPIRPVLTNATACTPAQSLRSFADQRDCSKYFCVAAVMDENFKGINKAHEHEELTECSGYILKPEDPCPGESVVCYLDADLYYDKYVTNRGVLQGGLLKDLGETGAGVTLLVFAFILLTGGLIGVTKSLSQLLMGTAKRALVAATGLNDYFAMLVGAGVTVLLQSSSVTTSALIPLCGIGAVTLPKMLALSLGANVGVTFTALLVGLAELKEEALQIAFCHFFFNAIGVFIWFPIPCMRQIPLGAARRLGMYAAHIKFVPVLYLLIVFFGLPLLSLGVSELLMLSVSAGIAVVLLFIASASVLAYWWILREGCYRVFPAEARDAVMGELVVADKALFGPGEAKSHQIGSSHAGAFAHVHVCVSV